MSERVKTVREVFGSLDYRPIDGADPHALVSSIEFSSDAVGPQALFFCVPGTRVDGHSFAGDAIAHGAAALVVEHRLDVDGAQFLVDDARAALAVCAANFYDRPSESLDLVGITGTNGKTTTAFLVEHLVRASGKRCGLMGTVECHIGERVVASLHTTPESRDLQALLAQMRDVGVEVAALEVSSHAIDLGRIAQTRFAVAAFTNLTQDHLDYHGTMEAYYRAKERLFTEYGARKCVVCTDGEYGVRLAQRLRALGADVLTVGSAADADVRLAEAEYGPRSTALSVAFYGETYRFVLPLVGRFNVENALVAFGIGLSLGLEAGQVALALESAPQVPGRLERVEGASGRSPEFGVLVDYAHTPDSVAKAIAALRAVTAGRVICVFGCGGDRDADKRPKMGAAALAADIAVVTSDNPRTEDPDSIIEDIVAGMAGAQERFSVVADRRQAIRFALRQARCGDAVLIAGKGHEDYQIIGTVKHPFDDRRVAAEEIDALWSV